ncbi:MAG: GPW/gp25 family protein [FCB group bacterium]|nr:GPW/gp25 family protein [FCB group bacterium]
MEYLALPFVLRQGYLDTADILESITYSVGLLLSSRPGSMPFDPEYGCDIWDKEYSDLHSTNKAEVRSSLRNAIDRYEKRLYNVSVSFTGIDKATSQILGINIKVTGNYREDDEEKRFEAKYRVG